MYPSFYTHVSKTKTMLKHKRKSTCFVNLMLGIKYFSQKDYKIHMLNTIRKSYILLLRSPKEMYVKRASAFGLQIF